MTDTVVACLTPPGSGAVATLAVYGSRAWDVIRERGDAALFAPETSRVPSFRLGSLGGDQVLFAVKATQPVPWVEIHCHGGREVVLMLLEALASRGAAVCSWQEFQRFTADDPLQALATEALAHAPTLRTASVLLDQYNSAFRDAVAAVLDGLGRHDVAEAETTLAGLIRHVPLGRRLTTPWQVVIAGAPNVGKSSLLNALAGYQRSVVSPTPGTTRDVVTTLLAFDGWPVEAADTAGLRDRPGELEGQGIERARRAAASADLTLWVLDASAPPVWPDPALGAVRLVVNKVDLPFAWDVNQAGDADRVSARTGDGVVALCASLGRRLVPEPPLPGAAVPFTPSLCAAVEAAYASLSAGDVVTAASLLRAEPLAPQTVDDVAGDCRR